MMGLAEVWLLIVGGVLFLGLWIALAIGAAILLGRVLRRRERQVPVDVHANLEPVTSPRRAIVGPPPHRRHPVCAVVRHPVRTDTKELPRARTR